MITKVEEIKANMEFKDLTDEEYREYIFPGGIVRLDSPIGLNISSSGSGGHYVVTSDEITHYIPSGWMELRWKAKQGEMHRSF